MPRRFSIIIVHRNGTPLLRRSLTALMKASDPVRDEVFVVDNGSNDDSPDLVQREFPHAMLIRNHCNNGFARANNQAIAHAQGEYIVLLNNDAFLAPDALDRIAAVFEKQPRAAVVAGQLLDSEDRPQRSAGYFPTALDELGLRFLHRRPRAPVLHGLTEVESVVGACMAVRTNAIRQVGALDEDFFFYFEETEWCHRFRRHGWQVWVEPAARITHLTGASTRGKRRGAQIEMLRSRLIYYRKTMPMLVSLPLTFWRILRLLLNTAVQGALVIATVGLVASIRERFAVYGLQVLWLASGCPVQWGLPDKCRRGQTGTTPS